MHDYARRRRAKRTGRQKGCTVYIPAEQLQRSGLADRWPLYFRVWGGARGRFVVVLYEEP